MIRVFSSFFLSTLLIDRAGQLRRYLGCPVPTPPIARRMGELVPPQERGGKPDRGKSNVLDSDIDISRQRLSDFRKLVTMDGQILKETDRQKPGEYKKKSNGYIGEPLKISPTLADLYKRAKDESGVNKGISSATDSPRSTEKQKIIEETGKQKPKEYSSWKIEN